MINEKRTRAATTAAAAAAKPSLIFSSSKQKYLPEVKTVLEKKNYWKGSESRDAIKWSPRNIVSFC